MITAITVVLGTCVAAASGLAASADNARSSRYRLRASAVHDGRVGVYGVAFNMNVRLHQPLVLTLIRNGSVIATSTPQAYGARIRRAPKLGDVMRMQSPPGTPVVDVVYDAMPRIPRAICTGATIVRGRTSPSTPVVEARVLGHHQPNAQVQSAAGTFVATFTRPLATGNRVHVVEERQSLLGSDAFTYRAEAEERVRPCR